MKLVINNCGKAIEFGRSYSYRVLFKPEGRTFEDFRNDIYIYER